MSTDTPMYEHKQLIEWAERIWIETGHPSAAYLHRALASRSGMAAPAGETPRTDALENALSTEWKDLQSKCAPWSGSEAAFNDLRERHTKARLEHAKALERELAAVKEKQARRNKHDPVTRLHNLCDGLQREKEESPYGTKAWDELQAENDSLRKELAAVKADLAKAIGSHVADLSTWHEALPVRDEEAIKKARFWDQWTIEDCKYMARAYLRAVGERDE